MHYELCTKPREICAVPSEGGTEDMQQGGLWCWQQSEVAGARCASFKMAMCYCQVTCCVLTKFGAEWSGVYCRASAKFTLVLGACFCCWFWFCL